MKTLLEVREYNFEGGTSLTIELDRRNKTASFVEYNHSQKRYMPTAFKFAGRELSYMNGWLNILGAMRYVIDDCKETMEAWKQEETDALIQLFAAIEKEKQS